MRILLVDHQDSFTWNLVHELGELAGCVPEVCDSNALDPAAILAALPDLIVLGPGPGHPALAKDSGRSHELLQAVVGRIPLFGVCFGLQLLAHHFGARVVPAAAIVHGKSLEVRHAGHGLFAGLPSPVAMMRYHSFVVERVTLPSELEVTAESGIGEVMALEHRELPIAGVQFHPESVGSPQGRQVLANVLGRLTRFTGESPQGGARPYRRSRPG